MQLLTFAICVAGVAGSRLHDAIAGNQPEALAAGLDNGDDINAIGDGGQTPLMMAVLMGKNKAVKTLLARGADTTIGEKDGYTPCHGAGFQGRADIMKMLIEHGLPCKTDKHKDGYTPLHRACWGSDARHTETVRALLKAGVPPDQASSDGKMPVDLTSNAATRKLLQHRLKKLAAQDKEL